MFGGEDMALFERIGKKLSDAGQEVARQTKNFTDVTRLNSEVSDRNRRITQLYTALGQVYFEKHKNDPDALEKDAIEEIKTLFEEISQREEEIKQIKGVVKCPNCGADVSINSVFCSSCGTKMESQQADADKESQSAVCPNCGSAVMPDAAFCN